MQVGTRSGANLVANETYFVFDGLVMHPRGFVLRSYWRRRKREIPETCTTTADCDTGEICQDSACIERVLGLQNANLGIM